MQDVLYENNIHILRIFYFRRIIGSVGFYLQAESAGARCFYLYETCPTVRRVSCESLLWRNATGEYSFCDSLK